MFETVVGIIAVIVIAAAFITGGAAQGILAILGVLAFGGLFEILGLWN
jgi:hypothetical protein